VLKLDILERKPSHTCAPPIFQRLTFWLVPAVLVIMVVEHSAEAMVFTLLLRLYRSRLGAETNLFARLLTPSSLRRNLVIDGVIRSSSDSARWKWIRVLMPVGCLLILLTARAHA